MASLHRDRRKKSPYWYVSYRTPDGRQHFKSTKERDRAKAVAFAQAIDESLGRARVGAFTEGGADSLNLNVSPQTGESLRSIGRLRYSAKGDMGFCHLTSYLTAGWRHEFKASGNVEARLASGAGDAFSVSPGDFGRDGLVTGIGVSAHWGSVVAFHVDYSGDYRALITEHIFDAGLHLKF